MYLQVLEMALVAYSTWKAFISGNLLTQVVARVFALRYALFHPHPNSAHGNSTPYSWDYRCVTHNTSGTSTQDWCSQNLGFHVPSSHQRTLSQKNRAEVTPILAHDFAMMSSHKQVPLGHGAHTFHPDLLLGQKPCPVHTVLGLVGPWLYQPWFLWQESHTTSTDKEQRNWASSYL